MDLTETVRDVVRVARDRELTFMAASIAHYTLASLVPLLLLAVALASLVGGEEFVTSVVRDRLASFLSASGQQVLVNAMTGLRGQVGAGLAGIGFTLWSGSKVFRGLDVAFADLYGRRESPSLPEQLVHAVVTLALLALAVGAVVAVSVVVSLADLPVWRPRLVGTALLLVALLPVLLPIYYVLTPDDSTVREVFPGAAFAAVGVVLLQIGFLYYVRHAGRYRALGVLGAVLLFITWLYFSGIVILLGAAVNYVTGRPAA
jgi:membrane protein